MKHTAILLALLLSFSLTACSVKKTDTTATNKNSSAVTDTEKNPTEEKKDESVIDDKKDGSVINSDKENDAPVTDGTIVEPDNGTEVKRFIYSGKLYTVSDEKITQDKVGAELLSITSMSGTEPEKDGEAVGLDEGVKVYKLAQENEYRELAVEIDGEYYLARLDEDVTVKDDKVTE